MKIFTKTSQKRLHMLIYFKFSHFSGLVSVNIEWMRKRTLTDTSSAESLYFDDSVIWTSCLFTHNNKVTHTDTHSCTQVSLTGCWLQFLLLPHRREALTMATALLLWSQQMPMGPLSRGSWLLKTWTNSHKDTITPWHENWVHIYLCCFKYCTVLNAEGSTQ